MRKEIGESVFNAAKDANSLAPALLIISFMVLSIMVALIKYKGDEIKQNENLAIIFKIILLAVIFLFVGSFISMISG